MTHLFLKHKGMSWCVTHCLYNRTFQDEHLPNLTNFNGPKFQFDHCFISNLILTTPLSWPLQLVPLVAKFGNFYCIPLTVGSAHSLDLWGQEQWNFLHEQTICPRHDPLDILSHQFCWHHSLYDKISLTQTLYVLKIATPRIISSNITTTKPDKPIK